MHNKEITAAVLIIGDEILSGRTKDTNSNTIALAMQMCGIRLKEVRVIADDENEIIATLNQLRNRYSYVFTCGGIGPTHDDITADSVAKAFGIGIDIRQDAIQMMKNKYRDDELTAARLRMARIPDGAILIANPISFAPGFQIDNVFVMAGVPNIMKSMLEDVIPRLQKGQSIHSKSIKADGLREGDFAITLGEIAKEFASLSIGSYPWFSFDGHGTQIVVRGTNSDEVEKCANLILKEIEAIGIKAVIE